MKSFKSNIPITIFIRVFVYVAFISFIFAFWTDRSLDFWATYYKGEIVDVPFYLSWLITFLLNATVLVGNVVSEIARLFV